MDELFLLVTQSFFSISFGELEISKSMAYFLLALTCCVFIGVLVTSINLIQGLIGKQD